MNVIKETPGTSAAGRIKGAAPGPVHVLPATLMSRGSTAAAEHNTIWPEYEVSGFGTATTTTEAQEGYFRSSPGVIICKMTPLWKAPGPRSRNCDAWPISPGIKWRVSSMLTDVASIIG